MRLLLRLIVAPFLLLTTLFTVQSKLPMEISKKSKRSRTPIFTGMQWRKVQKKSNNTVVQLFVSSTSFNWLKPFETPNQSQAWGTGFFVDGAGHIVTNFHVIDDAVAVKLQLPGLGQDQLDVSVVGGCPDKDVALLKLTDKSVEKIKEKLGSIPYLKLGDSDKVVRTQEVLALGYPLGQEKLKSTQGIVSGRENLWGDSYIQTTAAINNGNSGGPSLNHKGEVIGINTASISKAQNVGYIIPINDVKSVIEDLHNVRLLRKPFFGADFNKASEDMVEFLNNPQPGGFYVARVSRNTLFDKAGIKDGDMLYELNGHTIDRYGETRVSWSEDTVPITSLMNRFKLGQEVTLKMYRSGTIKNFTINFDLVDVLPIRKIYPHYEKVDYEIIGGMVVMELTLNHVNIFEESLPLFLKYRLRKNQYKPRLVITHILHGSQTKDARVLQVGDIIINVNDKQVSTLAEFRQAALRSQDFLSIKTERKHLMVLAIEKIIQEEDKLAERNFYKKSKLVLDLEKNMQ